MADLTFTEQIQRFEDNEIKIDVFVNGDSSETYTSSYGVEVPSITKFLSSIAPLRVLGDGVTDNSLLLSQKNSEASSSNGTLSFVGISKISNPTTITVPIQDTLGQIFTPDSLVIIDNGLPVRPEWFGNGMGTWLKAGRSLGSRGGVVLLSNNVYKPADVAFDQTTAPDNPTSGKYFGTPNITFRGDKLPEFNSDCSSLVNGSIIQGFTLAYANNVRFENVGFDCGKNVLNTYFSNTVVPLVTEAFWFSYPNLALKNAQSLRLNASLHNVRFLAANPSADVHSAILGEGYDGVQVTGIVEGCFGFHGLVVKAKNVTIGDLASYGNNGEGVILKSDAEDTAKAFSIKIGNIKTSTSAPPGKSLHTAATGTGAGLMLNAQNNDISGVKIQSFSDVGHANGLITLFGGAHYVDNVYIGSISTDTNSTCGVNLNIGPGAGIKSFTLGAVNSRNTPIGLYTDSSVVQISSFEANSCGVGIQASGSSVPTLESAVFNNCSSAYRLTANARPIIGSAVFFNTSIIYATDAGGLAPSLSNSWSNFGAGQPSFNITLKGNSIILSGLIKPGTGTVFANVPFWARPVAARRPGGARARNTSTETFVPITIGTNGDILVNEISGDTSAATTWLSLDGISYERDIS